MDGLNVPRSERAARRPSSSAACVGVTLILAVSILSTGCTHFGGTSAKEWIHNRFKVGHDYRQPATAVNQDWINGNPEKEPCPCCEPDEDNAGPASVPERRSARKKTDSLVVRALM